MVDAGIPAEQIFTQRKQRKREYRERDCGGQQAHAVRCAIARKQDQDRPAQDHPARRVCLHRDESGQHAFECVDPERPTDQHGSAKADHSEAGPQRNGLWGGEPLAGKLHCGITAGPAGFRRA